ncbi:MAG TPA: head GIN domain-containing protein [Usitatibacteraceae bacterium]|nr:head GIN domain-containing protein [Usitatibacteraceae bacterium]
MTQTQILRRFAGAFAALLLAAPLAAHADWNWGWGKKVSGSGVSKTETRQASGFTGIGLAVSAKLEVRQGASEGITLVGDDNILPLIETVVESGRLKIRWAEKNLNTSYKDLRIIVDAKTVESLSVAGSGDIHADALAAKDFSASISGSGDIRIKTLTADKASAKISGSGDIVIGGKVQGFEAKIAGSGNVQAGRLEARSVAISIAGSGDATVWPSESLSASVAGSGDIKYYGDAKVSKSIAGSGSVKRLGISPGA